MKEEKLEKERIARIDINFKFSEKENDYTQEIDTLIEFLNHLKDSGCTHIVKSLDYGFRYLSKKESLDNKIKEENERHLKRLKELDDEYNIL
jgi:hypothetical protein